jgi:all-trans-8'-apo-beta-carotenal 15,15'-oxygenase
MEADLSKVSTSLARLRVSPGNDVQIEEPFSFGCEFPQHDWRLTTSRHRYAYLAGSPNGDGQLGSIIKVDHERGSFAAHELGEEQIAGEPIFVPRSPDSAEDDGWLLSVVYSPPEHRSRLVVLDARDVESEPVAQARLRHHVPLGFHGTFTRRVAATNGDAH